jgi:hypothetical protein
MNPRSPAPSLAATAAREDAKRMIVCGRVTLERGAGAMRAVFIITMVVGLALCGGANAQENVMAWHWGIGTQSCAFWLSSKGECQ